MNLSRLFIAVIALLCVSLMFAAKPEPVADPFELTIEENLNLPKIGPKQHQAVKQQMATVAAELQRHKYSVTKRRDGEVITVSIPCSVLFAPNDTSALLPHADALLRPIVQYAAEPDLYKLVITVHSDNTGSEDYRDAITEARANIIAGFFEQAAPAAAEAGTVIPYGMGHDEPLGPDESIALRSRNRRIEINIVPLK